MYLENYPCQFRTSKDSEYIIERTSYRRHKKWINGKEFSGAKNIFYMEQWKSQPLLDVINHYYGPYGAVCKVSRQGNNVFIVFKYRGDHLVFIEDHAKMYWQPVVGLVPFDIYLEPDGTMTPNLKMGNLHIGDPIIDFLPPSQ